MWGSLGPTVIWAACMCLQVQNLGLDCIKSCTPVGGLHDVEMLWGSAFRPTSCLQESALRHPASGQWSARVPRGAAPACTCCLFALGWLTRLDAALKLPWSSNVCWQAPVLGVLHERLTSPNNLASEIDISRQAEA